MKRLQKNCLLLNKIKRFKKRCKYTFAFLFIICFQVDNAQVINYVSNGSFEDCIDCSTPPYITKPKNWGPIDSNSFAFFYCDLNPPITNLPYFANGYQFPKSGSRAIVSTIYCDLSTCSYTNSRNYPRNILKKSLEANVEYCVKFYVVNYNGNTLAIDAFGAYFGDDSIDTITYCRTPLTYLNPQVQNQMGIITDTLRWTAVTGTFVANGSEKYMVLGNFRSNNTTNTLLINPSLLPQLATDIFYDDVSVIELNLPAFAGRDTVIFVGDSVFLGREPDVGINEACIWYKFPNTTNPVDTIAGFWIKPTTTETYVVRQEICGNVKWDTVVVKPVLYTGNSLFDFAHSDIRVFPNPADRFLELKISGLDLKTHFDKISIYNSLGQIVTTEEVKTKIGTESLPEGVYLLELRGNSGTVSKRFVIAR